MRIIVTTYRHGHAILSQVGPAIAREADLMRELDAFERDYRSTFGVASVYRFNSDTGPKIRTTRQPDGRHYVIDIGD